MVDNSRNWAGNQRFQSTTIHLPESVEEIQKIVSGSQQVKAIGARHSFNDIADTPGDLIAMQRMNRIVAIDPESRTATVQAGMPYGAFCAGLHEAGFAVHNMASLPQITVGGACATATHGSGDANGNLATAVSALRLVTADGDIVDIHRDRDGDDFRAAVVGLGGFGVVVELTLDIRPAYSVRQDIYENLPVARLEKEFDEIMALGYSVSLFTDWQGEHVNQLWIKRLISDGVQPDVPAERFGAQLSAVKRHPVSSKSADICNDQLGMTGPWHERLPHFRVDGIQPNGEELQAEYFVARKHASEAIQVLSELGDIVAPVITTSEVRTVAEDDIWMSSSYGAPCAGLHFSWKLDWPKVRTILPVIEERLRPFEPRPHWGKLFTMEPHEVRSRYPRMDEFRALMASYDPSGKFRNAFLDKYIYG